ncbi:MAG: DNA methyltransferase [Phycisphaerales bacterium]
MKTKSKRPIHQVVRGDSMLKLRSIGDGEAQLVLADPPYGIAYQSRTGVTIANDKHPYIWWLNEAYRICADGGGLLCFTRWDVQDSFKLAIESAGFRIRSQIVWDKCVHGMGDCKAQFAPKHEVVWWATKGKSPVQAASSEPTPPRNRSI